MRKNHDNISSFIDSLSHTFSFICISETWLGPADSNLYGFYSYQADYCHCTADRHGGSATFISPHYKYRSRFDLLLDVFRCETVLIETDALSSPNYCGRIVIRCIYGSPSSSVPDFLRHLSVVLQKITSENMPVLIVGDININTFDVDNGAVCA